MANGIALKEVHKAESTLLDILFIHGLSGNDTDTWTSTNNTYWPAMISDCLPNTSVFALNYPSDYWRNDDAMDSYEKSLSILDYLTSMMNPDLENYTVGPHYTHMSRTLTNTSLHQ